MTSRTTFHRIALLSALVCVLSAPALARGTHVNEEVGYKILVPKDFELDQGSTGRSAYIVDNFNCTKPLPSKIGWTFSRHMRTFYFPEMSAADIAKQREESEKKAKEQAEGGGSVTVEGFSGGRLYQSFEEYAKDNINGFFFDGEKQTKIGGFDATIYEMQFEKLTEIPQRWMACSYRIPGGEFAVLFSCTEQHYDKLKGEFKKTFGSFKMLDKNGLKAKERDDSLRIDFDDVDEDKLTAEELLARRKQQKEKAYKGCVDGLEKGWSSFETKNFLVAYACPPRYAKEVSAHAEGVFEWLEDTFGGVGEGYVQSMIIRVYEKEADIPQTYRFVIGKGIVREIDFARPESRGWTSEFYQLSRSITSNWFQGKNDQLWDRMPTWLERGLLEYVDNAELKGSKLVFEPEEWERAALNDALMEQKKFAGSNPAQAPLKPLKILLTHSAEDLWSGPYARYTEAQCSSLVRYFLEGPGAKNKKTSVVLPHYLGHLYDLVAKIEAELEKDRKEQRARAKEKSGMSDEERLAAEDEAYRKKREQAYEKVALSLLDDAAKLTFADWDDGDWTVLDSSWNKYAEGRIK